ncbi:IclR family transcriptional regulator [Allopusillimonas soli]|uniref:IclR family transcriptional regulator n=1 Tax=Allopusillimonas soli TaxID=659016 RepID=A0A853FBY9_9BURK|nr:IclR family transcriptional regulator [Allopusillimonas soli]NYT36400.1 IclR family transcriptional regulator [Allopusillimonas soli]TEA74913.1 IclR family transcriptional regulator [Allopusillimonas soli]
MPDKDKAAKVSSIAVSGTQTIQRAASLLRLLTAHNRTGMRLVDLYQKTGLERSTTHRILQGLIAEQLVAQHPDNKRYFLGARIYEMGLAAAPPFNLRDLCHPHIRKLAEATGDTVFLVTRAGFDGVCIDRMEGSFPIRVFVMDVGRRRPLNIGAANISMLSTLSDEEIRRVGLVNEAKIKESYPKYSERDLWNKIKHRRQNGYVINTVLEVAGAKAVAVPVRTTFEKSASVALSVSAVENRLSAKRVVEIAALLLDTAENISAEIKQLLR